MTEPSKYDTTIGLEVHVQLSTRSKIFCGCSTKFGAEPNTQTCPVCLGLPGVLPVFNREALRSAIKVGLALNCIIAQKMKFDRKHYFYPDLPKDFQISQYDLPLAKEGILDMSKTGQKRAIRIKRVHLEEDAGKLIHMENEKSSLVDFNRAGMPLLEVVSEPDITSPEEAYDYLTELKKILKYLDVSDCNMEEGSLRCDANISIKPRGRRILGVKTELKNMNTFKGVRSALTYEVKRQMQLVRDGEKIIQDTRLWNEADGRTHSMRIKEEAYDYRYFPEPDLVPFMLNRVFIDMIRKTLPEFPREKLPRFIGDYMLSPDVASVLVSEKALADYFEKCCALYPRAQIIANWIIGDIQSELNKRNLSIEELGLPAERLAGMLKLIEDGSISGKMAKDILVKMIGTNKSAEELIKSEGLSQISCEKELGKILEDVIAQNPKPVGDYKKGKETALKFLVGMAMKATKGKANPKMVNDLLKKKMGE